MAACRAHLGFPTHSSKKSPLVMNHPFQTPGYICPFPVPFLPSLQSHLHSLPYKQAYGQASLSLSLRNDYHHPPHHLRTHTAARFFSSRILSPLCCRSLTHAPS